MAFAQGAKLSPENPAESERDRPQERERWFLRGRMVDGKPGAQQLHRAYQQKLNNRRLQGQARVGSSQGRTGVASPRPLFNVAPAGSPPWTFLGPAPTATAAVGSNQQNYGPAVGRVTAVAVDQGDTSGNTVYIGGASGGLWKTTNAVSAARSCDGNGVCTAPVIWTPLTDGQATLTVGSIALQPGNSNLVLVGTGEANNSADSYYGLGILRSIDGGANWSPIISSATCPTSNPACPSSGTVSLHGLGFTHIAFSTDLPNRVVTTAAAASGGITVGAETGGSSARGIYYSSDAGVNWSRATVSDGPGPPDPGSANAVIYNSVQKKFYANIRYHGFYSSSDGASWTRLQNQPAGIDLASCPSATDSSCPLYRAEMAIVPGRDEMYVWIYDVNENDRGIFQTKDGGQTWTSISTAGIDVCGDGANNGCGNDSTGQGTYNIALAAVPNGSSATDLYAGGVNEYKCTINPITNATCTSSPFLNLTHVYGCSPVGVTAHVHPDEHGIDFLGNDGTGAFFAAHPSTSPPVFFGNDGGIYRALQSLLLPIQNPPTLTNSTCPSGAPASQFDNLNASSGFSMIQFVGFAHAAADATTFVGGTQDNGSPAASSAAPSSGKWLSVNHGDGGFNAINPTNANEWFTSNPAPLTSGGGIQRCASGINCAFNTFFSVVTQDKLGGDESSFYTFFSLDPQASGRMLVGTCRVWRGNSDGSQSNALGGNWSVNNANGTPLSVNLGTQTAAGCASSALFVNTIAAGGPCNGPCDAGANPGSASGGGSQAIWAGMEGLADVTTAAAKCPAITGSTAPCGGQVWRTLAADTGTGSWSEVSGLSSHPSTPCSATPSACNINPKHYPISSIALDPHDTTGNTAYVTVMGFGVGHVFKTTDGGNNWVTLDGNPATTGLPDAPADAVVADPTIANLVYVGTDVGVFKSTGDGIWTELGPAAGPDSLPNVAITQLKIYNNSSDPNPLRLRASTYGRGLWEIPISPVPGYTMAISNSPLFAFAGQTSSLNGTIRTFDGYNSAINISCTGTSTPSTCSPAAIANPATNGNFSITVGNSSVADFNFNITAVGTDSKNLRQESAVVFHAVDFSLGPVSGSASVPQGDSADVSFDVSTASSQYTGNVTLTCSGQPPGTSCVFSPAVVSLTPRLTAHVNVTISTSASTTLGPYTVTITGTGALGTATKVHTTSLSMTVTSAALAFNVAASAISQSPVKPGQKPTAVVTVNSPGIYAGTLALSCSLAINGGAGCAMTPSSATLTAGQTAPPATMTVDTTGAAAADLIGTARAFDASTNASKSVNVAYSVIDYSLAVTNPAATVPGASIAASVTIAAAGNTGYTGTVAATCAAPSPLTCSLNPAGPFTLTTTTTSLNATATIAAPSGTAAKSYAVTIHTNDTAFTALTHDQTLNVAVQDFSTPAICNAAASGACSSSATVKAGSAATFNISVGALGGFGGAVTLACSAGLPALTTCTFSSNPVAAGGSSTLSIATTAASVSQLRRPASHGAVPLYAFWLATPGIVGVIVLGIAPNRNRGKFLGVVGLMLALGILIALPACGGGGGGSTTTPPIPKPGTPAGTYNITITGTSGSGATFLSHSATITLTVQ